MVPIFSTPMRKNLRLLVFSSHFYSSVLLLNALLLVPSADRGWPGLRPQSWTASAQFGLFSSRIAGVSVKDPYIRIFLKPARCQTVTIHGEIWVSIAPERSADTPEYREAAFFS